MTTTLTPREKIIGEAFRALGGGIVRIELTPEHFDDALNFALDTYRQRSSASTQERCAFLDLEPGRNTYNLPQEIIEVRQIFRRATTGTASGTGMNFEPFGAAFVNQMTLGLSGGNSGSLVTYELMTGFQELVGKMFGAYINYSWNHETHELQLIRDIRAPETVLLWVYNHRPETSLLNDTYSRPWLLRCTVARAKIILGEARSKFGTVAGPQGGTTLNGDSLKAEGQAEYDALLEELKNGVEQNIGYGWVIG